MLKMKSTFQGLSGLSIGLSLRFKGEEPNNSSWTKKEVLGGTFGNFEVLNGPVL